MFRRVVFLAAGMILGLAICSSVNAYGKAVFGPETFRVSWWHVHLSSHSFQVEKPGIGNLKIVRGNENKVLREGFLLLNSEFISLHDFLTGSEDHFEKDVPLLKTNRLIIFLMGEPGASIIMEIRRKAEPVPPPEVEFSAVPDTITLGESSTLSWNAKGAQFAGIDHGIGEVALTGSIEVSPGETTTYVLTATGEGGPTSRSTTVKVNIPLPSVTLTAMPEVVEPGKKTLLTWTSSNADSCIMDHGIGEVGPNGEMEITLEESTEYNIIASGPGGTGSASAQVMVVGPPEDLDYGLREDEQQGGTGLVGEAIRILNGNALEPRFDVLFSSPNRLGLALMAYYNSRSSRRGSFGYGWTHTYEVSLETGISIQNASFARIVDETGRGHYFLTNDSGGYSGFFGERTKLESGPNGTIWHRLDGSKLGFDVSGRVAYLEDESGNRLELEYGGQGELLQVLDHASGRRIEFEYDGEGNIISLLGPVTPAAGDGVWARYSYDDTQNLKSVIYADGSGVLYSYEDGGDIHNLTETLDLAGHLLKTWTYDSSDRVLGQFTPNGKGANLAFVSENQVDVTDAYGILRSYFFTEIHGQKRVDHLVGPKITTYTNKNAKRWTYDDDLNLVEVEYFGGMINRYLDYDEGGNPRSVTLASGTPEERSVSFTYHPEMEQVTSRTEQSVLGNGNRLTLWDFDNDGNDIPNENPTNRVRRIIERGYTKDESHAIVPYEYITRFDYNQKGQITSMDGPLPGQGDTTHFEYDETSGNLSAIDKPLIGSTVFSEYDDAGRAQKVTNENNHSKTFSFDGRGRLATVTNVSDNSVTRMTYNSAGKLETVTDPDNITRSLTYDDVYGRLMKITEPDGSYISYGYDDQGNRVEESFHEASGLETYWKGFDYQDPAVPGRLYKMLLPDGSFREYGYDERGNPVSARDPNGHVTSYEYDSFNRVKKTIQPGGVVTSIIYDVQGQMASVVDAEGHETIYEYDDMGRLVSRESPDVGKIRCTYDPAGNLLSKTDANGTKIGYTYDLLNRLLAAYFPDPVENVTYGYDEGEDGTGQLTEISDQSGSTHFGYDSNGRLISKRTTINEITYTLTRSFTAGNRLETLVYPTGRSITYTRNAGGEITGVNTAYEGESTDLVENISYLPFGPARSMIMGLGSQTHNVYDKQYRLVASNPGAETERRYNYDGVGNVTGISILNDPWKSENFTYDELNRLSQATGPYGLISYTYDGVGNRLSRDVNGKLENYHYVVGSNRLDEITGINPVPFAYDTNGNTTGIGAETLSYNQGNHLVRVEQEGGVVAQHTYNGLGQRVIKAVGGKSTVFHYDFEGHLIAEGGLDGTVTSEYIYFGKSRLARIDQEDGSIYYYLNDHLGTPNAMTDADGQVVWDAICKPFGEADVNPSSTAVNHFRFPGQYFDAETGLHYNYYRDYHPRLGRYMEPDGIGLKGGVNLYAYALNNPENLADPSGQMAVITGVMVARIGIGAAAGAFGGWVAGMKSGHVLAGIFGGVAGGILGGAVGIILPQESGVVGMSVGGAIAGFIGGGVGGGVGKRLSDPKASNKQMAVAIAKGAGIGSITSGITGAMGGAAIGIGSSQALGELAGTMASAPIGIGLSLVDIEGRSQDETFPEVVFMPENVYYPDDWFPEVEWDPTNPEEIDRSSSITLNLSNGLPPFIWSVSGNGFSLAENETEELSNTLFTDSDGCGSAIITVTGRYGAPITGYVRCTVGQWVEDCAETAEDWWGTCCEKRSTYIHPYKYYAIWQCNEFGHLGAEELCGFNYMDGGGCAYRGWNTLRYVMRYEWDCPE